MIYIPEEIKQLFFTDSIRKNLRIIFPNGELPDITNSNLIVESFSFSESICSRNKLKFGLCEASVVKFETFGIGNIRGMEIDIYHEIDITSLGEEFINQSGMRDNKVAFPFYRIPYGRFIVESCEKQADMTRRKIVAYTKEITWENIPNPLERAKYDGRIDVKDNSPYKFNVPAVVYSNSIIGDRDLFAQKELCQKLTADETIMVWSSEEDVYSYDKNTMTSKYQLFVSVESIKCTIRDDIEADNLFYLKYDDCDLSVVDDFVQKYLNILEENEYKCNSHIYLDSSDIKNILMFGYFNYSKYSYHDGYGYDVNMSLDDYRYVYPFLNTKNNDMYQAYVQGDTHIGIPYKVTIILQERYWSGVFSEFKGKEILKEEFVIRNSDNCKIYKIKDLPNITMSVERKKYTYGKNTGYRADKEKIDYRKLIEAYAEFNGYFGRHTRKGDFEFFRINNYFGVYPREDLYPSENLFPNDPNGGVFQGSQYISAWYDDAYTKPYDRVSVTYKNEEDKEAYDYYQIVPEDTPGYVPEDYQTYSLSDNYLISNCKFNSTEISKILEELGQHIGNIRYMPAKIQMKGIPWLEAGDVINILTKDDGIETIVLSRDLSGIHTLKDTLESK